MLKALTDTLNPQGGHGMTETIIAITLIILVVGLIVLNYLDIEVSPMVEYVVTVLLGYVVGTNHKEEWDGEERRNTKDD